MNVRDLNQRVAVYRNPIGFGRREGLAWRYLAGVVLLAMAAGGGSCKRDSTPPSEPDAQSIPGESDSAAVAESASQSAERDTLADYLSAHWMRNPGDANPKYEQLFTLYEKKKASGGDTAIDEEVLGLLVAAAKLKDCRLGDLHFLFNDGNEVANLHTLYRDFVTHIADQLETREIESLRTDCEAAVVLGWRLIEASEIATPKGYSVWYLQGVAFVKTGLDLARHAYAARGADDRAAHLSSFLTEMGRLKEERMKRGFD